MKSLKELEQLRDQYKVAYSLAGTDADQTRVMVGLATCGVAAGARPVYDALVKEVEACRIKNVMVVQTGCVGICQYEPVVEIVSPKLGRVTYVHMTAEKMKQVVAEHLLNGKIVEEYTIGAAK